MTAVEFGWDSYDSLNNGDYPPSSYDVINVLNSRHTDIPTVCGGCGSRWLTGREARSFGMCWSCRVYGRRT